MPALRESIKTALASFSSNSLKKASYELFSELGYHSERTLDFGRVESFCEEHDKGGLLEPFQPTQTWKDFSLIFQLTGEDIKKGSSKQLSLLAPDPADLSPMIICLEYCGNVPATCPTFNTPAPRLTDQPEAIEEMFTSLNPVVFVKERMNGSGAG